MPYTRGADSTPISPDGKIYSTKVKRDSDLVELDVVFNANMTDAEVQTAIKQAFETYDAVHAKILVANKKIDDTLAVMPLQAIK